MILFSCFLSIKRVADWSTARLAVVREMEARVDSFCTIDHRLLIMLLCYLNSSVLCGRFIAGVLTRVELLLHEVPVAEDGLLCW